ncbi:MAG: hypothetical protein J6K29_12810 [Clostridia bacterium]|nr:hypothetical protein [Clostridia bacterium]
MQKQNGGKAMRIRISPTAGICIGGTLLMGVLSYRWGDRTAAELRQSAGELLAVALAALIHELGHMLVAWRRRIPVRALRLDLFGARMELSGMISYGAELAVASGGPLASFLAALTAYPWGAAREGIYLFSAVSCGLGLLNLLPVRGMDGGRILACFLSLTAGERAAETALRLTTGITLGGLWLLSVYALLRVGQTVSLFAFTLCLLIRLLSDEK